MPKIVVSLAQTFTVFRVYFCNVGPNLIYLHSTFEQSEHNLVGIVSLSLQLGIP